MSSDVHAKLKLSAESEEVLLEIPSVECLQRMPGMAGETPDADVIQVCPEWAERLGPWALALTPALAGPLRVKKADHVPPGSVRVAYAARSLIGLKDRESPLLLQRLDPSAKRETTKISSWFRLLGETLFGAPVTPLRSMEGLVGDDDRLMVRVDPTALDFLGIQSGDQAFISWGQQSALVRVLLQTESTRAQMRYQLNEETGYQQRLDTESKSHRAFVPEHLRVWVAASVRDKLNIPPDSTVRLRRSVRHLLVRNLSTLAFPLTALVIAMAAVPGVPWFVWAGVGAIVLVLSALPLRLR